MPIKQFSSTEAKELLKELVKLDSKASTIKVYSVSNSLLWNPTFKKISNGSVVIAHEDGIFSRSITSLSVDDKKTIMGWSDGTWKIEKPGLYGVDAETNSYGEMVLNDGRFYTRVTLESRQGENAVVKSKNTALKIPLRDIHVLPGLTAEDSERIESWADSLLEERIQRESPKISKEVLAKIPAREIKVTNVSAKVMQVLNDGVLASAFVGTLHNGTIRIRTTSSVTVEHPLTMEKVTKQIHQSVDEVEDTTRTSDDLCFIQGDTSNFVDGDVVKVKGMKLEGRYQYQDVLGRPRTLRKYIAD